MLEKMLAYQKEIEKLLSDNPAEINWGKEREFFEIKLNQLQKERLMHLLVTLTVGLSCLLSCFISMFYQNLPLLLLDGILIILFLAYLIHYRKLENTTQSWYPLLDQLKEKT